MNGITRVTEYCCKTALTTITRKTLGLRSFSNSIHKSLHTPIPRLVSFLCWALPKLGRPGCNPWRIRQYCVSLDKSLDQNGLLKIPHFFYSGCFQGQGLGWTGVRGAGLSPADHEPLCAFELLFHGHVFTYSKRSFFNVMIICYVYFITIKKVNAPLLKMGKTMKKSK